MEPNKNKHFLEIVLSIILIIISLVLSVINIIDSDTFGVVCYSFSLGAWVYIATKLIKRDH